MTKFELVSEIEEYLQFATRDLHKADRETLERIRCALAGWAYVGFPLPDPEFACSQCGRPMQCEGSSEECLHCPTCGHFFYRAKERISQ